jgi:hypothetical protein
MNVPAEATAPWPNCRMVLSSSVVVVTAATQTHPTSTCGLNRTVEHSSPLYTVHATLVHSTCEVPDNTASKVTQLGAIVLIKENDQLSVARVLGVPSACRGAAAAATPPQSDFFILAEHHSNESVERNGRDSIRTSFLLFLFY